VRRPSTLRNAAFVLAQLALAVAVLCGGFGIANIQYPSTSDENWVGLFIVWPTFVTVGILGIVLRVVLPGSYLDQYDPIGPHWVWGLGCW
jgi:hypothetical protein